MNKQLSFIGVFLLITVIVFTAVARQKENKGQGKEKDKQENKGKGPAQKEKKDDQGRKNDKDPKQNNGNNKNNGNDKNDNDGKGNNGKGNGNDVKMKDGYQWNTETFRDRDKFRKQEKVSICHKVNRNGEPPVTIRVSANALNAHLAHGDVQGECNNVANSNYSDGFLRRRTDYYTTLQNSQEQVVYSKSILEYALERLTNARSQLVVLQRSNAPQAEIERKQVVVTELEQNVSLLDQLIGITANLLVNKLVN
jgi:hypothetical protein